MFDVGFSELIVIALVALIVIGPERLPRVARTVGALLGRAQRYVNDVKSDIQREVELDELNSIKATFQDAAKSVEQSVNQVGEEMQAAGESLNHSFAATAENNTALAAEGSPAAVAAAAAEANPTEAAAAAADATQTAGAAGAADATPIPSAQMVLGLESKPAAEPPAAPKA